MKVGILTPHSQLNYGGVLQAWAMIEAFRKIDGVEPVFLDWWRNQYNEDLERGVPYWGRRRWIREILHAIIGLGIGSLLMRQFRTKRLIRRHFALTSYHFCKWAEVASVGVDMISVGSDQVWYYAPFRLPDPYLLDGAPHIPAIAYAASFGMPDIPGGAKYIYEQGFKRFKAIGVREKSAVAIVRSCGSDATHVADPTIMVGREFWIRKFPPKNSRRIVCYLLSDDVKRYLRFMHTFARKNHCKVDVLVDSLMNPVRFAGPMGGLRQFLSWARIVMFRLFSPVRLHLAAGPVEFVKLISRSRVVVTDSFHGLMFASIYQKDVRVIRPTSEYRINMFSRISDFTQDYVKGDVFVASLQDGLSAAVDGNAVRYDVGAIDSFACRSRSWLENAVRGIRTSALSNI